MKDIKWLCFLKKKSLVHMTNIQSFYHQVYTIQSTETGQSHFDDECYVLDDKFSTLAYSHLKSQWYLYIINLKSVTYPYYIKLPEVKFSCIKQLFVSRSSLTAFLGQLVCVYMNKILLLFFVCLILYVPSTIFQLNRDGSSSVAPVLS